MVENKRGGFFFSTDHEGSKKYEEEFQDAILVTPGRVGAILQGHREVLACTAHHTIHEEGEKKDTRSPSEGFESDGVSKILLIQD
ncbi:hypothetical protein PV327_003513 [Microctonus hyperodae]|uniref:Uncharacterized protein n=1 Tax=Microctonus hyperodae TaxID=165561 RepID=A0AA39L198_MICHY|nr:hypothetical protein PV327_003513 [Microctonus hyperodae]